MSQQLLEKPNTGESIAVDIYQEAETAIRQVEKFEKLCPSWVRTTTPRRMRHERSIKWGVLSDEPASQQNPCKRCLSMR